MKQEKQEKKGDTPPKKPKDGGSVSKAGGSTPKARKQESKSHGYVMEHKGIPKLYIYKVAL